MSDKAKSASTVLVDIAEELYEVGVSDSGEAYGIPRSGAKVVRLLRGGKTSLRAQLAREYFRRTGKAAPQQALADAMLVVEGIAQDTRETSLALRVARHNGALWLDLGDATGLAVRITGDGWAVKTLPAPVLFKRTALNSALPVPEPGGSLDELWAWLNVAEDDQPLLAAWLASTLDPDIPHPVVSLSGEQGTGKSTATKVLVSLLDPSPVPLRKPPRDAESWVTAAAGSWVVGVDNLSVIPDWLSDSVCRAVTGEGDVRRKLYTDGDFSVFSFRRCLAINGIDLGAVRGDLADRLLPIQLEVISERNRRQESELWPQWTGAHPRLLGAVLDLAASVQAVLPSVRLDSKPRMADYAHVLAAVDAVLGTSGLARYLRKQGELATDSLADDPFVAALAERVGAFTGTSSELLHAIAPADDEGRPPKGWPTTARQITQRLRRQAPVMRKAGWTVEDDGGANHDNRLRWTVIPPARERRKQDSQHSRDSQPQVSGTIERESARESASYRRESAGQHSRDSLATLAPDSHPDTDVSAGRKASRESASLASHDSGPSQDAGLHLLAPPCPDCAFPIDSAEHDGICEGAA